MRSNDNISQAILCCAQSDNNIRAVILNGSRANKQVKKDKYQDFDLVFFVQDINAAKSIRPWEALLGVPVLQQCPDDMLPENKDTPARAEYTYLMIYEDGHRIDLTLFPLSHITTDYTHDSLSILWLDKDNLFNSLPPADESSYFITPPDARLFAETANEFWWCATNVAKGLARHEITFAKEMTDNVIRPVFMQMLDWKIGCTHGFNLTTGKAGKYISRYLTNAEMQAISDTYSDAAPENNWQALFVMLQLFGEFQKITADKMGFAINTGTGEAEASVRYIKRVYADVG
ncbi:aminoglycoside 6-adenylyltransferase [Morganella psychrotolerans]|uniref:Aminoglycoside 6-adenylyltransferase n=1 Tax=Morganella psychrotolerans TaxID=368603 RepID=A0A5M9RBC2_9GAMM|nr:aminoglycoside 6-adenylyltransferase [Morganella psychrotolerans]KAA8717336.1 aminoglycoside 6-adenylyltransferase [Morganella psychrotolerans]